MVYDISHERIDNHKKNRVLTMKIKKTKVSCKIHEFDPKNRSVRHIRLFFKKNMESLINITQKHYHILLCLTVYKIN